MYLIMMVLTLTLAFNGAPVLLLLASIFLQWCALIWYIASYIPFGQRIISKCLRRTVDF
jgi:hypothetical protein